MARLVARNGGPFRPGRALAWATSWSLGAAAGVALGAWLTVVGEAGAPGVGSLDLGIDLVVLPAAAFVVVFVVHLSLQAAAAWVRGRRGPETV